MSVLWREWRIAYCAAALRHLRPTHPDVPELVIRLHRLTSERSNHFLTTDESQA